VARALMELQWKMGDASEALRTFEALKRTLSSELDVAPDARTLALAQQIREGRAPPLAVAVTASSGATDARATPAPGAPRERAVRTPHARSASVAILPFVELGRIDPAGYLGNGLADELHRMLGQCAAYRVASRAGALSAVRTTRDMGTLRTTLDVDWVVDGTVALQDAGLEVHARLLELATGRVHSDETFAVARADVHGACARILPRLFTAAGVEPDAGERALLAQQATGDALAFDAFLQGRHFWRKRPRDSGLALARLREAVERDASFALAHAALADVYNTLGSWEAAALPSMEAFPKAQDAALAALCIDPRCAEAHTSLAYAAMHFLWQWDAAGRQFRRALTLNPNYAHAHHWYAHQLMARGETGAALESSLRALALDPLDLIINVHLAWHYWLAGEYGQAYEQAQRTARLDERDHWVHFFSGLALSALGESSKAVDAQRKALTLCANSPVMAAGLGYAYGAAGDRRLARRTLADLPRLAGPVSVAYEQAVVAVDPRLAPLAADPRFRSLLLAVGLDDVRPPA
jgi:tetratricopeptide (TPR) repeat protein